MEKFKKGDEVYISRKVLFEINTNIRGELGAYVDFPLVFDYCYDNGMGAYVTHGISLFSVPVQYLLTKKEYEAETNNLGYILQKIKTDSTLKENISPPNVEYTFFPKSEVISVTVDGIEGFLIKK
ncbi:MAG: hypothetical protein [Caudoviricetes sp.]|nr:MAG: hypothetical protein [Caudoviricetes sp.]